MIVNVQFKQTAVFTNTPSEYIVSRLCSDMHSNAIQTAGIQADVIALYADTWSTFKRTSATDFDTQEWVKRNFTPSSKDFEKLLKNMDARFDSKNQVYKNTKVQVAKAAYAGIDIAGMSLADIKKAVKGKTTLAAGAWLTKVCSALVPMDEDVGLTSMTPEEYRAEWEACDDQTIVVAAFEALAHAMGVERAKAALGSMQQRTLTDQTIRDAQ